MTVYKRKHCQCRNDIKRKWLTGRLILKKQNGHVVQHSGGALTDTTLVISSAKEQLHPSLVSKHHKRTLSQCKQTPVRRPGLSMK